MKYFLTLFLLLVSVSVNAFDFDSYKASSFSEVINNHKNDFGDEFDIAISAISFKYKATVIFSKDLREISKERKSFIENWAKAIGQPKDLVDSYQKEFLIKENDIELWLPMQEQVLPFMGKELTQGKPFEIYFVLAGIDHGKWIFLGTEFQVK